MECDVAVVGCGVVGLAAAVALQDRGVDVVAIERGEPGNEQSRGLTRIFRVGHEDQQLTELALEAKALWGVWEQRFRRHLLNEDGLLGFGEVAVSKRASALEAAGVEHRILTPAEWAPLMPLYRSDDVALYEPGAGSIRARRTIECLVHSLTREVVRADVTEIAVDRSGATLADDRGVVCHAHTVVVCCGNDTPDVVRDLGIDIPVKLNLHSRFTLQMSIPVPGRVPALMDDAGYAVRVGSTDQYAIGVGLHKAGLDVSTIKDPEEWRRVSWEFLENQLQTYWPGLRADQVDELRCRFPTGEWMVAGSEGFAAWQKGPVIALCGGNLFKFAPLLGDLLAQSVVEHQIPAALRPRAT